MYPPFSGFVLDPSKCRKLTIEERRDLIHELAKWPESAPEKLQKWSRRDLLEILCVEMGKERKYTGLTKQKLIEYIFRIVSEKKPGEPMDDVDSAPHPPPRNPQTTPSKRQRKSDQPSRLPIGESSLQAGNDSKVPNKFRCCTNLACRATVGLADSFCKRCSCCICHKYDDNKDPSLWLVCSSEVLMEGDSCGMSCHLECALKHERSGIAKTGQCIKLDGCFYCTNCGKVNDLLGCWRKQLMIAQDARRVDVLCYRVSLSHKLLSSTEKYQKLHEIVEEIIKKLESEVGPLNGLPNMGRGIVNRLSVGADVQKLCRHAVMALDYMHSVGPPPDPQVQKPGRISPSFIKFEDICLTSVTVVLALEDGGSFSPKLPVGYSLWYRKADNDEYPTEPAHTIYEPKRSFSITNLAPSVEYAFKVTAFCHSRELAKWEARVHTASISSDAEKGLLAEEAFQPHENCDPPSEGDESNNAVTYRDLNKSPDSCFGYSEKPEVLDLEQSPDNACKNTSPSKHSSGSDTMEQEEMPGHSSSMLDEEPNLTMQTESHRDSTTSTEQNQALDIPKSENESNAHVENGMVITPYGNTESSLPATPCRKESLKECSVKSVRVKPCSNALEDGPTNPDREPLTGCSSKKRVGGKCEELCPKTGLLEGVYEYCVKVIRWLECEGHIETNFRVKFLTWFSLRATAQERNIVSVYIDTLIDDPGSLAGQLVDTFSEAICSKRPPPVPTGFCMQLWH